MYRAGEARWLIGTTERIETILSWTIGCGSLWIREANRFFFPFFFFFSLIFYHARWNYPNLFLDGRLFFLYFFNKFVSSIYYSFSLKKKKKTLLIIKSIKIVYSLKFLIPHRIYGVHFSMGHSLLDFSLKEKKKKRKSSQRKHETSIGDQNERKGRCIARKGELIAPARHQWTRPDKSSY